VKPTLKDIIFNVIDPKNCPASSVCNGHPALRDINVRLALAYATDKKRIIETTMSNMATPGLTLVPQQLSPWFNTELKDYPFDLDTANKILDDNVILT
jgi:ABC-type transport system substrate-binding protein